jgi:type I restriction enzyme S subunit
MTDNDRSLPDGWNRLRLADFAQVRLGRQRSPVHAQGLHMKPYVRAANVTWNGIDISDVKEMNFTPKEQETYRLHAGDILMSEASGSPAEVGKPAIWSNELPECYFQNTLIRVRPPHGHTKFLFFQLLRDVLDGRFIDESQGVGINHLSAERASNLSVVVAPEADRARVVEHIETQLSRVDVGVASLKSAAAKLKSYRASILKDACEGRLVPTEAELARRERRDYEPADRLLERILVERRARWETDQLAKMTAKGKAPTDGKWKGKYQTPVETDGLLTLPEGWCWSNVATVGDVLLGRQRAPQFLTGKWSRPYLRVANVKDDRVDFADVEQMDFDPAHYEKYKLQAGDILVSEGQSLDRVGESAIYAGGFDGLCFQKTLHRFRPVSGGPSSKFAQIVFRSHVKNGLFRKLASITTNIAHLTLEKFEAAPFPLPPAAEQVRIVAEVDRLMSFADDAERAIVAQLARAKTLRRAVLRDAFEGRLLQNTRIDARVSEAS